MGIVNHSFDEDRDRSSLTWGKSEEERESEEDSKTANSDLIGKP